MTHRERSNGISGWGANQGRALHEATRDDQIEAFEAAPAVARSAPTGIDLKGANSTRPRGAGAMGTGGPSPK